MSIRNCIYILGLDRGIIEQAVKARFNDYENAIEEAAEYVDKIIQLPFDLPPLSGEQMENLVVGLDAKLPQGEDCVKVFAYGQEANPRKVKRTINVFLLLWELSRKRQLHTAILAIRLAKIVVIQNSYRELYRKLIVLPSHLGMLEAYFRQLETQSEDPNTPTTSLPEDLAPFMNKTKLKSLLTLHSTENEGANFTKQEDGEYRPVPLDVIEPYIDLTSSISRELSLDGVDLRGNDLRGARLSERLMREANLSRADLSRADLSAANLQGANLQNANLTEADLSRAYLSGANLSGAELSGINLNGANLSDANLSGTDLRMAEGLTLPQINEAITDRETMLPSALNSSEETPDGIKTASSSTDKITKKRVIEMVAEQTGLTRGESQRYLDAFTKVVTEALKAEEEVQITGFGKFYVQKREAREGINPQTKEKMTIPGWKVPKFTAGNTFKQAI